MILVIHIQTSAIVFITQITRTTRRYHHIISINVLHIIIEVQSDSTPPFLAHKQWKAENKTLCRSIACVSIPSKITRKNLVY